MKKPTLYLNYNEFVTFRSLALARQAFVYNSIKGVRCVLVRENGLNVEVTVNEPQTDTVTTKNYPNYKTLDIILNHVF